VLEPQSTLKTGRTGDGPGRTEGCDRSVDPGLRAAECLSLSQFPQAEGRAVRRHGGTIAGVRSVQMVRRLGGAARDRCVERSGRFGARGLMAPIMVAARRSGAFPMGRVVSAMGMGSIVVDGPRSGVGGVVALGMGWVSGPGGTPVRRRSAGVRGRTAWWFGPAGTQVGRSRRRCETDEPGPHQEADSRPAGCFVPSALSHAWMLSACPWNINRSLRHRPSVAGRVREIEVTPPTRRNVPG
jgi:hypothetical protein